MKSVSDIRLRALEPEDLELMYRIENDTTFWRFGETSVPFSRYVLKRYIESASCDLFADGQVRFVVEGTDAEGHPTPLGLADLTDFSPKHQRAHIGMAILPEFQRQHIGLQALAILLGYARNQHIHQLYAVVATTNEAANGLFRRQGFCPTAVLKEWIRQDAGYVDAQLWQHTLHPV